MSEIFPRNYSNAAGGGRSLAEVGHCFEPKSPACHPAPQAAVLSSLRRGLCALCASPERRISLQLRNSGSAQLKKTPLCSLPNCAKLVFVVDGSDSKWKPCLVPFGVVAETAIVAEHSKKSPRN